METEMVNKNLFNTRGKNVPVATTTNAAGGRAYEMSPQHALAQFVCTGFIGGTYYASAEAELETLLDLANKNDPEFVGKAAVYAHQTGYMKDAPSLLAAVLAKRDVKVLRKIWDKVIDSGNMLRNFAQIIRSDAVGRKSFGHEPKRLMRKWFESNSSEFIFHQSIGNNPTLGEVIKMVHPKPDTPAKAALFAYLMGKKVEEVDGTKMLRTPYLEREWNSTTKKWQAKVPHVQRYIDQPYENLPDLVKQYEAWKADKTTQPMPKLNFRFLDNAGLDQKGWVEVAKNANWMTTLKNLNTFVRHGVFLERDMVKLVADRLQNAAEIKRARVFPYQIMMAFLATNEATNPLPSEISKALEQAMELSVENVPVFEGNVKICPDVSGSMKSPVTGYRGTATSKAQYIDVAALVAASVLRRNPNAEVMPFEYNVVNVQVDPKNSIMNNAEKLAKIGGGGTNCSAPLRLINQNKKPVDVVVFVSDNESWVDSTPYGRVTETMKQWLEIKKRNNQAKLICIDLTPRANSQTSPDKDILLVGGFNDKVWDVVHTFINGNNDPDHWVKTIDSITL